jgi:hypothetical protein
MTISPRQQLDNLADALVEDILAMPDDELMAEFIEDGGNVDELVARGRTMFERAKLMADRAGIIEHEGICYALTWDVCPWCGGEQT